MFRKLVKTSTIEVEGQGYALQFFEEMTLRGACRFSCEVALSDTDRIIVDEDSMPALESRVARVTPATVYSRWLAARRRAA